MGKIFWSVDEKKYNDQSAHTLAQFIALFAALKSLYTKEGTLLSSRGG